MEILKKQIYSSVFLRNEEITVFIYDHFCDWLPCVEKSCKDKALSCVCFIHAFMQALVESLHSVQFSSVQSLSSVWLFATPQTAAHQASLSITNCWSLLKLTSIKSGMPSNHRILCLPLFLLLSIFPSIRVFPNESVLPIRWQKYWSFSFSISPFNEYSGLISFRIDWLDLLAVLETLKSLLQHYTSKASFLQCSAFFIIQLSHPYTTTGKIIDLTRLIFVSRVMSLLFNMLSRLAIAFLPRSKHLLISWLQLPSAVILEPKKIKSVTISIVSPSICYGMMGLDAMICHNMSLLQFIYLYSYCFFNLAVLNLHWSMQNL